MNPPRLWLQRREHDTQPLGGLGARLTADYAVRNEKMAAFAAQAVEEAGAQRVLVIVGAGHKLFLDREFASRGFEVLEARSLLPDADE